MAVNGTWRAYGKYGWMILFASAALGIFGGVALMFPSDPTSQSARVLWLMSAWGITWVGFNILALAVIVGPYRRGERWAWCALWIVPLLFVGFFLVASERTYSHLVLAILSALGLILPYRWYFSDPGQQSSRVRSTLEEPSPPMYFDE
jgi:hypothetical protein